MADRIIENQTEDIPAMPEGLQRVLMEALEQGKADLEGGYDIVPFTMLVAGGNLFTATPSRALAALWPMRCAMTATSIRTRA